MKNIKKQWFTLVELIVVITILAILWSIAFISLQWYSADARNSKRTSDLSSLTSGITTNLAQWQSLLNFVTPVTGNQVTSLSIAWTAASVWSDYNAWTVNYSALWLKTSDFQDPSSQDDYVIWATTKINGKYELAADMEQGAGQKTAKVVWNYNPRAADTKGITTWSDNNVVLSDATSVNFFALWDTVTDWTLTNLKITRVSSDGMTITLSAAPTAAADTLALSAAEWTWLISTGGTLIVTDWGTNLPY